MHNLNRVYPQDKNNVILGSPDIKVKSFNPSFQRGRTTNFINDNNLLMPVKTPSYVPSTFNNQNDKKESSPFGFFKRMLSNQSRKSKNGDEVMSPASAGHKPKGILKRATTERKGGKKEARRSSFLGIFQGEQEESLDSEQVSAYRRYQFIKRRDTRKDVEKSKDLFKVLKLGAFHETEFSNENMAKLHVLDLMRISKKNSLRSSKSRKSSKSNNKGHRNGKSNFGILSDLKQEHLLKVDRDKSPELQKMQDLERSKNDVTMESNKRISLSTSLLSNNHKQKIFRRQSFAFRAKKFGSGLDNSLLRRETLKMLQDKADLSPIPQSISAQSKQTGIKQRMIRSSTINVKRKKKDPNEKEMTIEELKAYILSEKMKLKQEKTLLKAQQTMQKQNSMVIEKRILCCVCKCQRDVDNDESEDISSDDCDDNAARFKIMQNHEKNEHLQMLWKKSHIKARAGANVVRLFNDLARKIYLFGVSKGLTQIELEERIPQYILMPGDRSKQIWNMITILMLLYTALFMPYKVAFLDDDSDSGLSGTLDWVVDSLFFTDIIITFFSAFEASDGSIEFSFPFQVFAQDNSQGSSYQKLLRLLRLPRLFRMITILKVLKQVKFLRENRTFNKIMKKLRMNTAIVRMIQGMVASVVVTHLFACFWFLTSKFDDYDPDTWVYRMHIVDEPPSNQYLYSLYWSTQTVITVGYGDIPAVSVSEMILSLFWMVFGVGFYSFIIGNYSSIISSNIQIQASIQMKIKSLAELAKKASIPIELSKKIKKFIENNFEAIYNQEDETQLIKMLPPSLRDEVLSNTFGEVIEKVQFFREMKDPDFLWKILPLLRPIKLEKGDILYWRGDHAEDRSIKLYTERGYPYIKYNEGDLFGDSDTLLNLPRDGKAIAMTHLKLMVLKIDQMFEKSFENQEKNFMEMIFEARKKRNLHLRLIQVANKKGKREQKNNLIAKKSSMTKDGNHEGDPALAQQADGEQNDIQEKKSLFSSFKKKIVTVTSLFKKDQNSPTDISQNEKKSDYLSILRKKADKSPNTAGNSPANKDKKREMKQINQVSQKASSLMTLDQLNQNIVLPILKNPSSNGDETQHQQTGGFTIGAISKPPSPELIIHKPKDDDQSATVINKLILQPTNMKPEIFEISQVDVKGRMISQNPSKLSLLDENLRPSTQSLESSLKSQEGSIENIKTLKAHDSDQNAFVKSMRSKDSGPTNKTLRSSENLDFKSIPNLEEYWKKRLEQRSRASDDEKIYEEIKKQLPQHKNNKHSLIEKLLLSAYGRQNSLTNVYQKFPFLKSINLDEIVGRDVTMKPKYSKKVDTPKATSRIISARRGSVGGNSQCPSARSHAGQNALQFQTKQSRRFSNGNLQIELPSPTKSKKQNKASLFGKNSVQNPKSMIIDSQLSSSFKDFSKDSEKEVNIAQKSQNALMRAITRINEEIERDEQEKKQKKESLIITNESQTLKLQLPESTSQQESNNLIPPLKTSRKMESNSLPTIIVQERLDRINQQSKRDKQLSIQTKFEPSPHNGNNLSPVRIAKHNYDKAQNTLQLPGQHYGQSPKPIIGSKRNLDSDNTNQIINRSEDPSQYGAQGEDIEGYIKKTRTGSVRVIAQRPSFMIIRQNSPQNINTVGNRYLQNQFISPISLQRICSVDPRQLQNFQQQQDLTNKESSTQKQTSLNHLNSQFGANLSPMVARHNSTTTNKKSLSEAVSFVFEQKFSLKNKGKQQERINQLLKENNDLPPLKSKMTFTDAVINLNKTQTKNKELDPDEEEKERVLEILDQENFLDEQLLMNQNEDFRVNQLSDNQYFGDPNSFKVSDIRATLVEEIKKKFSKNLNYEYQKMTSQGSMAYYQSSENNADNQQYHPNGLTYDQMEKLYLKTQFEPFCNDQQIEFYGDPAVVGLVQFNADMGHIAMNVFETFTVFDLIGKGNQTLNESLQLIQSQNSIIMQRQDNMDRKLDEIEQQLLMVKQLKNFKTTPQLAQIPQEMRY